MLLDIFLAIKSGILRWILERCNVNKCESLACAMQTALVIEGFRTQWLKGVLDLFGENITIPLSTGDDIKAQSIHRHTKFDKTVHELHAIRSMMLIVITV